MQPRKDCRRAKLSKNLALSAKISRVRRAEGVTPDYVPIKVFCRPRRLK